MISKSLRWKRAASPILAAAVLFGFALVIGFLLTMVDPVIKTPKDSCVGFESVKLVQLNGNPKICFMANADSINDTLRFMVENNANFGVEGMHITIIGNSDNPVYVIRDYNSMVLPGGTSFKRYDYPKFLGNISEVKISIYRKEGSDIVLCPAPSVITTNVLPCDP